MLSFIVIKNMFKKYRWFFVLFGALFYSVTVHPESGDTPLAERILSNLDEKTQASLVSAFKFKDIALNKSQQNDFQMPIYDEHLIKFFDIYSIFHKLDEKTTTFFAAVACEDMLSNPSYTKEEINRKQERISLFLNMNDQGIEEIKKTLSVIRTIEMAIMSPETDMLQAWMDAQENKKSFWGSWANNSKTHLKNQAIFTTLGTSFYYTKEAFWTAWAAASSMLPSAATVSATASVATAAPAATASASVTSGFSIGATLSTIGGFCALPLFSAGIYTAVERIKKSYSAEHQKNSEKIAVLKMCVLNLIRELLKNQGALNPNPLLIEFITALTPITNIAPDFNEKPIDAAISIIESLYAVAQLDAYIALADLVRGADGKEAEFALAKITAPETSPVNTAYLEQMYTMFQGNNPMLVQAQNKNFKNITITTSYGDLKMTLPIARSQEMLSRITLPAQSLFHVHYVAQALGIVPTELKNVAFTPLNFGNMSLEIFTTSGQGTTTEILRSIRLPIA